MNELKNYSKIIEIQKEKKIDKHMYPSFNMCNCDATVWRFSPMKLWKKFITLRCCFEIKNVFEMLKWTEAHRGWWNVAG